MSDWRTKDDLELTADDLGQMLDEGEEGELVHEPQTPFTFGGYVVVPTASRGVPTVLKGYGPTPVVTTSPQQLASSS